MSKLFNEKNILFFLSFFLIIFVLINFTHNKYPKFKNIDESSYRLLNNFEFKSNINSILVSDLTYERFLTKKCATTGDMHDRHKVRWVKAFFLKNVFQFTSKINKDLPYYVNIILHSLIIFLTLIILNKTLNLKKKYIIFYLLFVTFIFQNYLGEYSFSIFEMFFLALALYASKTKRYVLAGNINDIISTCNQSEVSGIALASILHYQNFHIRDIKDKMLSNNFNIRR